MTPNDTLTDYVGQVKQGQAIGEVDDLVFRNPNSLYAGELHNHFLRWEELATQHIFNNENEVLNWIKNKVSVFPYFQHFRGHFNQQSYDSDRPPSTQIPTNRICYQFTEYTDHAIVERLAMGAYSLLGKVGEVEPPVLVLPLTVESEKPRLCYDARFLNLWMIDKPFTLDSLRDIPRYVTKDSSQTVVDDKSGYDHILLTTDSRTFFGFQWHGWYFTCNTLPFGWKISPYIYHTTGLFVTHYFRSINIPCLLYIDDRHNGQLQVALTEGAYARCSTMDERNFAAAKSAIFLVAYYTIRLGYFPYKNST